MRYAVFLFSFFVILSCGNNDAIKTSKGRIISAAEMDKFLETQLGSLRLPALSVAFFNDGKVVYHRTLGKADDEFIFEAASLSKPVFAGLALKMVEEGKLDPC